MINKLYTLETLKEFDPSFNHTHYTNEKDVEIVNKFIKIIEQTRNNNSPAVGDIVEYTDKYGEYYKNAHIEKIDADIFDNAPINICECPYIPFVDEYKNKFYTNTSGGAWCYIPNNLKLIGQREKTFCVWGHCGACAGGAVHFKALVNVWEYVEEGNTFNRLSTKDHDKFYVYIRDNSNNKSDYKYNITKGATNYTAFRNEREYKAWLKTFNGIEFKGHWENQIVVFTDKQIEKCVPLEQYQTITNCIVDSVKCNGNMQECKRNYENNIVTTYLPHQNQRIILTEVKTEYINAYQNLI